MYYTYALFSGGAVHCGGEHAVRHVGEGIRSGVAARQLWRGGVFHVVEHGGAVFLRVRPGVPIPQCAGSIQQ